MEMLELRKAAGLTQTQVASKLKITQRMVAHYESGTRRPRPEVAERIAALFGLRIEDVWEMFYASKDSKTN